MSSDTRFQFQAIGHGPPMDLVDENYDNRHLTRSDFKTMAAGYPGKDLLFDHDPERIIGKVVDAFVDPVTNNFVVTNEIDLTHPSGVQAMRDIRAGVIKNISLGYSADYGYGKNGAMTVTNKTPFEVSLVGDAERPESIITHIEPKSERERKFEQFFLQIEKEINSKKELYNQHTPQTSPKDAYPMSQQTATAQTAPATSQTIPAPQQTALPAQAPPSAQPPLSEKKELIQNPATVPSISGDFFKELDDESKKRALDLLTKDNLRRNEENRKKQQEEDVFIRNIAENLGHAWEALEEEAKKMAGPRANELGPYIKAFSNRLLVPSSSPLEEREKNDMVNYATIMSLSHSRNMNTMKLLDESVKNSQVQAKRIEDLEKQNKSYEDTILEQRGRLHSLIQDATGGSSTWPNEKRFRNPAEPAMPTFSAPQATPPQASQLPTMPSFSSKFTVTSQTPAYVNPNVNETNFPVIDPASPFSAGLCGDKTFSQLMERHRNTPHSTIKSTVDSFYNGLNGLSGLNYMG